MSDPTFWLTIAAASLVGLLIITQAALSGWRGWLDLKRRELDRSRDGATPSSGSRIELADLRERVRKLEAIAAGVDI